MGSLKKSRYSVNNTEAQSAHSVLIYTLLHFKPGADEGHSVFRSMTCLRSHVGMLPHSYKLTTDRKGVYRAGKEEIYLLFPPLRQTNLRLLSF